MDRTTDHLTPPSDDPEAIARDIRRTRAEMTETVDALGDKLDPSRLANEAREALTSKAHELVDRASDMISNPGSGGSLMDSVGNSSLVDSVKNSAIDAIKANPLPAAAVGLSVAWFLSKLGESETDRYRREQYAATGDPSYAPRTRGYYGGIGAGRPTTGYASANAGGDGSDESLKDKASGAFAQAKDKAGQAADKASAAKDKAGDLAGSAKDAASSAANAVQDQAAHLADAASHLGDQAQQVGRQSVSWLDQQMHESPLMIGAVALAGGALVGLALPSTEAENRLVGEEAERAKARASDVATEKVEQVRGAASEVAREAADKARDVATAAAERAEDVADTAKDKASDVASTAKDEASDVASTAETEAKEAATTGSTPSTGSSVDLTSGTGAPTPVSGPGTTRPPSGLGLASPDTTVDLTNESTPSGTGTTATPPTTLTPTGTKDAR